MLGGILQDLIIIYQLLKIENEKLNTKKIVDNKVQTVQLIFKDLLSEKVYKLPDDAAKKIKEKFNL